MSDTAYFRLPTAVPIRLLARNFQRSVQPAAYKGTAQPWDRMISKRLRV
jgi:hypothetical protein